jgi:hypothetical protein
MASHNHHFLKCKSFLSGYGMIVTHLAQVAAFGHQHLRVQKSQDKEGAQTTVTQLSNNQRVDEIVQPYVIPFIHAQANNFTFQQDNARPQRTAITAV